MMSVLEHEVLNRFHLARVHPAPEPIDINAVRRENRERIAKKIDELFLDCDTPDTGYKAGWNAALMAALSEIF